MEFASDRSTHDDMRLAVVTLLARAESLDHGARTSTRWWPTPTGAGPPS